MTKEELDFIGSMNMCDEISNNAYKKIACHVEETIVSEDCVSRQAVLNTLFYKSDNNCEVVLNKELQDRIKALPPVTPTQSWIPVSERLPKVGEKVLCQCQANIFEVLKLMVDGWYHDENHCYMSGFVIAWQPLPKPYEEKRGNENVSS